MATDTDSEAGLHSNRRITEADGNQETTVEQETSNALSPTRQNLQGIVSVSEEDREISDTITTTPGRFVSDSVNSLSKKTKWSPEVDAEGKNGLYECVNGGVTARIAENDLGFEKEGEVIDVAKNEVGFSAVEEFSGNHEVVVVVEDDKSVLDVQMDSAVQECNQGSSFCSVADEKQGLTVKEMGFDGLLSKFEEKLFLEGHKVQTQLVNLNDYEDSGKIFGDNIKRIDGVVSNVVEYDGEHLIGCDGVDGSVRCSLKIELIDNTALLESVPVSKSENGCRKEKRLAGCAKNTEYNGKMDVKQEVDGKKGKRPRRRGKGLKRVPETNEMPYCLAHNVEASNGFEKIGNGSKKMYSRKEMEALRFVNVKEQKKKWYEVYCGMEPIVATEYDDLLHSANQKHIRVDFDPRHRLGKNYGVSALPGLLATNGRWNYLKLYVH